MASLLDALTGQITGIKVESEYGPTFEIPNPFQPGPPNPFLQALKPKITLELMNGQVQPIIIAPYGEPSGEGTTKAQTAGLMGVGLIGALIYGSKWLRKRGK